VSTQTLSSAPPRVDSGARLRHVLVVDDHRTFAELLVQALSGEPDLACVGHAQHAAEARRLVERLRPDIVLTDVRLGPTGEDGVALTRALTAAHPDLVVVVLSAFVDGGLVRRAASAGASGVVPKDGALCEMLDVLRQARPGGLVLPPRLTSSLLRSDPAPAAAPLTPREQAVLELLAEGLDPTRISRRLQISVNTCRGYIKSLLLKLDAHTQLEAVLSAHRQGLIRLEGS
jgi:DNA-binding NarL/FixJ family response regulator